MAKVREYDSFAEIGTYLHRNKGEAFVKSYASANEPLKVDASEDSEMVHRLRVTINTTEDKGVKRDGSFYSKHVAASQTRFDQAEVSMPPRSTQVPPIASSSVSRDTSAASAPVSVPREDAGPSALQVLKNFVDNHFNLTLGTLGLGVLALIVAVIALVK
jgi:hypothetical protein